MSVLGQHLTWMWLVILALATYRLVRLVTTDSWPLWAPLRARLVRRWPPRPGAWSEVVVCPWCLGIWVAAAVLVVWLLIPAVWSPVAVILALSTVAGVVAAMAG